MTTNQSEDEGLRDRLQDIADTAAIYSADHSRTQTRIKGAMALISQKIIEAEKRAYKQGWDSAGGEMIGVKQDISNQLIEARIDERNRMLMEAIGLTNFTEKGFTDMMQHSRNRIATLAQGIKEQ